MSAAAELPWVPPDAKQEATAELRPLFEHANVGAAKFQRSGNILALNPALTRMLGATSRTQATLRLADVISAEDCPDGECRLRELFDGTRDSFRMDTRGAGPDGRPMQWSAWRVAGTAGESDYVLGIAEEAANQGAASEDETDPHAERRLRQAEKLEAVGRLAGGVAHDFNNVLTGVLLYCDLLLASIDAGHGVRKYAEEIRSAGIQATGLVRQLLAVARPRISVPGVLSLNETIEGMHNLLARLIGENIGLKFLLDPGLGLVKMDPTQAQQILLNLVLNARDAMPAGGEITIETSNCRVQIVGGSRIGSASGASLPCALFAVGDNGSGMDPETRAHLFEAFYTTKVDGRGTGLGLATVYEIVTSNGGLIHVASAPNCGARISVLLPLVPEEIPKSQPVNDAQPETNEGALPDFKRIKTP
jgi:PAS domain S-box-containing protein